MESAHEDEVHVVKATQKTEEKDSQMIPQVAVTDDVVVDATAAKKKSLTGKKSKHSLKKKVHKVHESSSSEDSDADSESEESSEDEKIKRKRKKKLAAKRAAIKKKQKAKRKKSKSKKHESSSDDSSESSSDSESDSDDERKKRKKKRKASQIKTKRKGKKYDSSSDDSESSSSSSTSTSDSDSDDGKSRRKRVKARRKSKRSIKAGNSSSCSVSSAEEGTVDTGIDTAVLSATEDDIDTQVSNANNLLKALKLQKAATVAAAATATTIPLPKTVKKNPHEFKRIDQVWDTKIRDYKLIESTSDQKDEFDCVFTVRRRFDWEGKHRETQVDIKSGLLRNALQEVFRECRSISLVEETPQIDPHTLFHYYDELKTYVKKTLKPKLKRAKKRKDKRQLKQQIAQCKLLLGYIDEDYAKTRKALKPMLKAGTITYDLCWALFKPNTIAYTPTYGNKDDARCFKVDSVYEYESWLSGAKSWIIDGRYLEYDGKVFGLGDHQVQISSFKGHKKITSLAAYPLKFHKDPEVSASRFIFNELC